MKKKIGIVSMNLYCIEPNYGSVLQTYALYSAISKLGYSVDVIDYRPRYRKDFNAKWGRIPWRNLWGMLNYIRNIRLRLHKWRDCMDLFNKRMTLSPQMTWEKFESEDYSLYVIGSDTVWNIRQTRGFDPGYLAEFKCMGKVLAYAPSFGDASYAPDEAEYFRTKVRRFVGLSVREPANMEAFGDLIPRVETVLDPTMLFTSQFYDEMVVKPRTDGKYVLLYQIYSDDRRIVDMVDAFARQRNWQVVEVGQFIYHAHPKLMRFVLRFLSMFGIKRNACVNMMPGVNAISHDMRPGATIGEWLGLIRNAEYVVTNSFHGTIFSILHRKNFFCYSRPDASSKMAALCRLLGLEERFLVGKAAITEKSIDYDGVVKPRLESMRDKSWQYLREGIKVGLQN